MILDAWGWCTGSTLGGGGGGVGGGRGGGNGMGREEGGGFRMGNTCIPVADSC